MKTDRLPGIGPPQPGAGRETTLAETRAVRKNVQPLRRSGDLAPEGPATLRRDQEQAAGGEQGCTEETETVEV